MPRQASFAGGELAPEMWTRTDIPGVRTLRNFLPTKTGAAMSRPGTDYLGPVKGGALGEETSTTVRLIPFVYSDTATEQNYLLEFGAGYIRFWSNGGLWLNAGVPYEVATSYVESDLPYIRWAQSGDVLTLVCAGHREKELRRLGPTSWTLSDIVFTRPACGGKGIVLSQALTLADSSHPPREWEWLITTLYKDLRGVLMESEPKKVTLRATMSEWDPSTAYSSGTWVTHGGHVWKAIAAVPTNIEPGVDPSSGGYWLQDDGGAFSTSALASTFAVYPDRPVRLLLGPPDAIDSDDLYFVSYRVYRGRSGVDGWIGDSPGGVFTDLGDEPDFSLAPPQGRNPFAVFYPSSFTVLFEHPGAVAYFDERRVFARTSERPAWFWFSATGDYSNFDKRLVPVADEALEFELSARRREEIRSLVGEDGASRLLAFTNSSVRAVGGSNGPISFDDIDAPVQSTEGASWLEPVVVDGLVLYEAATAGVRSLAFDLQRQAYAKGDISKNSAHLVLGHRIVSWAFAHHPWSVLWAVRDDGVLLSLTLDRESGVAGWARHDTVDATAGAATQDVVEQVCVIPEGTEDAVYLVVRRNAWVFNAGEGNYRPVRYMERLHTRVMPSDVKQAFALDSALSYSGSPVTTVSGLSHLTGLDVYAVADGNVIGPLTVADGGTVDLGLPADAGASVVHVGLAFTPELQTLDFGGGDSKPKMATKLVFDVVDSRGLSVGQDFDHLTPWRQRQVSDGYGPVPFFTGKVSIPVLGTWTDTLCAVVRQTQPLPCTITAITVEGDRGG